MLSIARWYSNSMDLCVLFFIWRRSNFRHYEILFCGGCAGTSRSVLVVAEENVSESTRSEGNVHGPAGELLLRQLMASAPVPHFQYQLVNDAATTAVDDAPTEEPPDGTTGARRSPEDGGPPGAPPRPQGVVVALDGSWRRDWQLPFFVILFAAVGFLAVTFVVLLWLKNQMLSSQNSGDGHSGPPAIKQGGPPPDGEASGAGSRWVFHPVLRPPSPKESRIQQTEEEEALTPVACPPVLSPCSALPSPRSAVPPPCSPLPCSPRSPVPPLFPAVPSPRSASPRSAVPSPCPAALPPRAVEPPACSAVVVPRKTEVPVPAASVSNPATPVRRCGRLKGLLERRGSSASLTIELHGRHDAQHAPVVTPTRECTAEEFLLSTGNVLSREQLRSSLKDVRALHREFWELPSNHPERAHVAGSGTKNRYRSILPNERTRVVLPPASPAATGDPLATYINANYVRGYDGEEKAFIATQGPLPHTVADFWSMVWAEGSTVLVMITKLWEKGRPKCESYFPEDDSSEPSVYGDVEVRVTVTRPRDGYTLRELLVKRGEESRKVVHLWYDTWPDHATPSSPQALVAMAREVSELRRPGSPVVVHCSAGIGRTGCFVAVVIGMTQLLRDGTVDVLGTVCQMRYDRGGMIQTAEQYEFVHRALCLFERSLPGGSGD